MPKAKDRISAQEIDLIKREMRDDPYRAFNVAFALMSVIPFLIFFYLLGVRFFTLDVFVGEVGLILTLALFLALLGGAAAYAVVRRILTMVVYYAARAKKSDELKSVFVAYVSHELRNPLTVIKTSMYNLLSGANGALNDEQKETARLCGTVVDRIDRLIAELLDLHKLEAGLVTLARTRCNMRAILERQMREFDCLARTKSVAIAADFAADGALWGDEGRLTEVVNNLLDNAVKYTAAGGSVTARLAAEGEYLMLEVSDTAKPIPADKLEAIFDKFTRADTAAKGYGLGLAITKDIVELHKGKIWAENLPDGGNRFTVLLPRDLRKMGR